MNAAQTPRPPKRRRIAGEVKPSDAPAAATPERKSKLPKPRLPQRPKTEPVVPTSSELPAAPPRPDAGRVPRSKPSVVLVILLILAVASVGFGAFGVWRGTTEWRSSSIVEARADAADAAAHAVEAIYSYKYNRLDAYKRASQAAMTPRLAKEAASATQALRKLAPLRKTQVKTVVRYAAAKECGDDCSPDKATVLVFFDMASVNADADKPTVESPRVNVFMVKREGKWLVDNIKAL